MGLLANVGASEVQTGTVGALNATYGNAIDAMYYQSICLQITGTWAGTITFQVSVDGTNWVTKQLISSSGSAASTTTGNSVWSGDLGARYFRVLMSAYTSGTATVVIEYNAFSLAHNIGTQSVQGTITALPSLVEQAETTTNLASGATYTGASRDMGTTVASRRTLIRPVIMHNNASLIPGTLILDESTDGTTWRETRRVPIPADGSYRSFEFPLHLRYYRWRFINGAAAQTGMFLQSVATQGEGGTMDSKNNLSFLLSATALGANATFTSTALDLGDNHIWDSVRLRVHTDQAVATDGIRIESSHDGTNWAYSTEAVVAKSSADPRSVGVQRPITERYFRVVVTNGAVAQTFLRVTLALISL